MLPLEIQDKTTAKPSAGIDVITGKVVHFVNDLRDIPLAYRLINPFYRVNTMIYRKYLSLCLFTNMKEHKIATLSTASENVIGYFQHGCRHNRSINSSIVALRNSIFLRFEL